MGLRMRPAWWQLDHPGGQRPAWPSRLGPAVCCGVVGCQVWHPRLEATQGDDLLLLPDLESEGAAYPVEDNVGAVIERVKRGDHAATPDPDEAGAEEISQELAKQLTT